MGKKFRLIVVQIETLTISKKLKYIFVILSIYRHSRNKHILQTMVRTATSTKTATTSAKTVAKKTAVPKAAPKAKASANAAPKASAKAAPKAKVETKSDESLDKITRVEALKRLNEMGITEADIKKDTGKSKLLVEDIRVALKKAVSGEGSKSTTLDEPEEKQAKPVVEKKSNAKASKAVPKKEPASVSTSESNELQALKTRVDELEALVKTLVEQMSKLTLEKQPDTEQVADKPAAKKEPATKKQPAAKPAAAKKSAAKPVAEQATKPKTASVPEIQKADGYAKDDMGFIYQLVKGKVGTVVLRMEEDKMHVLKKADIEELDAIKVKYNKITMAEAKKLFTAAKVVDKKPQESDKTEKKQAKEEKDGETDDESMASENEKSAESKSESSFDPDDEDEDGGNDSTSNEDEDEGELEEEIEEEPKSQKSVSTTKATSTKPTKDTPAQGKETEGADIAAHFVPAITKQEFEKYKNNLKNGTFDKDSTIEEKTDTLGMTVDTVEAIENNFDSLEKKFSKPIAPVPLKKRGAKLDEDRQ